MQEGSAAIALLSPLRQPRPFREPQRRAWRYTLRTPHPALLMEMRLGKTLLTIRAIRATHPQGPYLIIAPGSALPAWEKELAAEGTPACQIAYLLGPRARRLAAYQAGCAWNLINREGWRALPQIANPPCAPAWAVVVLDESHAIKNPRAGITKFFLKHFRNAHRRFILTGTINAETDLDIWAQLAFLDGQAFGCANYYAFLTRYYKPAASGFGWAPRLGTQAAIRKTLGWRAFILRRKDCNADVPKVYERRTLAFPPAMRKMYNEIETDFVSPAGKETKFAATKYHWLRQLCGGFADGTQHWDGKLKELVYLLTGDLAGDPVVVWFYYNAELRAAKAALGRARITFATLYGDMPMPERRSAILAFQRGSARVLLAQQAVAQMGADFSRADTAIYYSTPLGGQARAQTEDRIIDIERRTPTLILDLVVFDTVDEDAVELVTGKRDRGAWTLERARILAGARHGA